MSEGRVQRIRQLLRPVASLARAEAFYVDALGFERVDARTQAVDAVLVEAAYGRAAQEWRTVKLGQQRLTLVQVDGADLAKVIDEGSGDTRLQHLALVTFDVAAAWQHVQAACADVAAITQGGPQRLPEPSGGVTALKFRDPDGHPLELLGFPAGRVPRHWRDAAGRTGAHAVLGIDHTAIGVADAQASIRFYTEVLGFTLDAKQVNEGEAQDRLDGLHGALVDVVSLGPAHSTPHLELLGYHGASAGSHRDPVGLRAFTVLEVDQLDAIAARWTARWQGLVAPRASGHRDIMLAHDPDGHALLLWQDGA